MIENCLGNVKNNGEKRKNSRRRGGAPAWRTRYEDLKD